jgi:serine-type D-Ala-D-Ala carboxypeptidase/endopeptidase (penicillin-binding protein 4)
MLKSSINMYAEAVLRLATGPEGRRETQPAIAAAGTQLSTWGIASDAVRLADGSGLSRHNLITADALVAVLRRVASPLIHALPIAGVDGSLALRMRGTPAAGRVRAKTGSLTAVRSLAGYVVTADGEPLVFAILANNYEGPSAGVVATIDAIVVRLASFSRLGR